MSDEDDDLFADSDDGDSDDTNQLISSSLKKKAAPAAKKKGAATKKKAAAPAAKKKNDSDSDKGLFDSESEDEDKAPKKKSLSKRERLEALSKRKRKPDRNDPPERKKAPVGEDGKKVAGYESGDSYDSGDVQRTQDDDDFIDTTGEDAAAVHELYAEQHFDDERPDDEDEEGGKKKKKRRIQYGDGNGEATEDRGGDEEPDNPIMAAVHRMKKKKKEKKSMEELEDECKTFLAKMEMAAEQDETAVAERRPALSKLAMLHETVDMLRIRDLQRVLLDLDLLTVCRRWVQPLPNGTLGNVTVRQKLLTAIGNMTGETGICSNDLKRSDFGKTVMVLAKHRSETPGMKRQLKTLIEQWSRPIFQKSGNMRDLARVHASRGEGSIVALSSRQTQARMMQENSSKVVKEQDLDALITTGKRGEQESGINRVRVPFSKGFSYSVRPEDRVITGDEEPQRMRANTQDTRGKLSKRMVEKGRGVSKNQRSANISIEGRQTK
jgi:transcription factor SPN1